MRPKCPERGCVQRTSRSNPGNRQRLKVPRPLRQVNLLRLILPRRTQSRSARARTQLRKCTKASGRSGRFRIYLTTQDENGWNSGLAPKFESVSSILSDLK